MQGSIRGWESPRSKGPLDAPSLCALTPDMEPGALVHYCAKLVAAGVDIIQVRQKSMSRRLLAQCLGGIVERCRRGGVICLVDDEVDLALWSGADGVHLGEDDLPLTMARQLLGPRAIIGATANSPGLLDRAVAEGADYVGCGPVFATPIKSCKPAIGPQRVSLLQGLSPLPVFAIGGIGRDNLPQLRQLGIGRICIMRGLAEAADLAIEVAAIRGILA